MENLMVLSKVKKYLKEKHGCNSSAGFFEPLNADIIKSVEEAAQRAKKAGRKTVMGKDFSFFIASVEIEQSLVVASKVKKLIKEQFGLATSSQAFDQLTCRIQKICDESAAKALSEKRKTVMERDLSAPTVHAY